MHLSPVAVVANLTRKDTEMDDTANMLVCMCRVLQLAAPSIIYLLSGFAIQTVSVICISRLGQAQLAGAVLATAVINTTGAAT